MNRENVVVVVQLLSSLAVSEILLLYAFGVFPA